MVVLHTAIDPFRILDGDDRGTGGGIFVPTVDSR